MDTSFGFLAIIAGFIQIFSGFGFIVWLTRTRETNRAPSVLAQRAALALLLGGMFFVFLGFMYLMEVKLWYPQFSALSVGLALIAIGCILLLAYIPFAAKNWEASISILAQKASFTLIIGGLVLAILYFLNVMKLLPWWSSV